MSQSPYAQLGPDAGPNSPNPYGPDLVPMQPGRTSILAIIALVLAICGCVCPILVIPGPVAMILAGISIVLMATSNWQIRGVGIATTAICLGLLQSIVLGLLFFGVYQPAQGFINSAWVGPIDQFMTAAETGDAKTAIAELSPRAQAAVTPVDVADFVSRYHAELGKYQNAPHNMIEMFQAFSRLGPAMQGLNSVNNSGQPQSAIPVAANFEKAQAVVAAQVDYGAIDHKKPQTGAPKKPPLLNIGILTIDGKTIWMIDPDKARQFAPLPGTTGGQPPPPPGARGPGRRPRTVNPDQLDAETGAVRMVNTLPLGIALQKDSLHELVLSEANEVTGGKPSKFLRNEIFLPTDLSKMDRPLVVRRFADIEGKTMVQVRMDAANSRFGLASEAAEGVDLDKPLAIIDDHDKAIPPIGFVSRFDKHVWIAYDPATPLQSLHETGMPTISREHPTEELVVLFLVDSGSKIAEIRAGDHALVKFDPPLEAKKGR